jgi:hypothetical protein
MIDMGMGQDNGGDAGRGKGGLGPVAQPQGLEALEEAAIHQDAATARPFQKIFGARDGACATEEGELKRHISRPVRSRTEVAASGGSGN